MFDQRKKSASLIDTPKSNIPEGFESLNVFTIPDAFYDSGVHTVSQSAHPAFTQPAQKIISAQPPVTIATAVKTPEPLKKVATQAHITTQKGLSTKMLVILGVCFFAVLLAGGGAAYFFLIKKPIPKPTVSKNEPVTPIIEESLFINAPSIVTSTPTEPTPPKVYPQGLREFVVSVDSDGDELTDVEEESLFNSDVKRPDSDSDGYVDGHEVFHLYNPNGFKPVTLVAAGLAVPYENTVFGYTLLAPKNWIRGQLDADGAEVMFTASSGEFVAVRVHPNKEKKTLATWYEASAPHIPGNRVTEFITKKNIKALRSPDTLMVYIENENVVYELTYDIGVRTDANFVRTFEMMQNSFAITGKPNYLPSEEIVPIISEPAIEILEETLIVPEEVPSASFEPTSP